jgi:hypothetical protein
MFQGSGAKLNKSRIMPLEVLKVLDHMTGKGMIIELTSVPARFWGVLPSQQVHLLNKRPDVAIHHIQIGRCLGHLPVLSSQALPYRLD